jgi:hypothetical protein
MSTKRGEAQPSFFAFPGTQHIRQHLPDELLLNLAIIDALLKTQLERWLEAR